MGPKPKKGKPPPPKIPEIDPKEIVTELEKEFFEFQLADIEKKLSRIDDREEEMKAGIIELEEKIIEFKKEKGAIVDEYEQTLLRKEEEKCMKREEMTFLAEEIKNRVIMYKKKIEDCERKYNEMVTELTQTIEQLEEEVRILEDYRQNKDTYNDLVSQLEEEMQEAEVQHQRNLFEIEAKLQKVKMNVKKELAAKLLNFSIEFREANQQKIGNPCHRVTQENKAIRTVLMMMNNEIFEYENKYINALETMKVCKDTKDEKQDGNDKVIARTSIQVYVIKTLRKQRIELLETLKGFHAVEVFNQLLHKKLQMISDELRMISIMIEETKQDIETKIEDRIVMMEALKHLRKSFKRLKLLLRNSLKIAEEALAVRLIPMGGLEEEKYLTMDAKIRLFRIRRDNVFTKKGNILKYLLDFLSSAQLTEDDRKLLTTATSEVIDIGQINFGLIYGTTEVEEKISIDETESVKKKQTIFLSSLTSLPRSEDIIQTIETRAEYEGEYGEFEGEFGEQKVEEKTQEEYPGEDYDVYQDDSEEEENEQEDTNAD